MIPSSALEEVKSNILKISGNGNLSVSEQKRLLGISVSRILEIEDIRINFSREDIDEQLRKIVEIIKELPKEERALKSDEELAKLDRFYEKEIGNWRFVVPIDNLKISVSKFKVGKVTVYTMDSRRKKEVLDYLWNVIKDNPNYTLEQKKRFIKIDEEKILMGLWNKACAEITIRGKLGKIHDLALTEISKALRLLKLYNSTSYDFRGEYFGIPGETALGVKRTVFRFQPDAKYANPQLEWIGPLFEFELNKDGIENMRKHGFRKLSMIIAKNKMNELEERILSSIYWYSKALDTQIIKESEIGDRDEAIEEIERLNLGERFMKLAVAMESLLIFDRNEPIGVNISERIAFLLGRDFKTRKKIKDLITQMYNYRSDLVHRGQVSFSVDEMKKFQNIVQNTIITFVKRKDRLGIQNTDDLKDWFEKQKLG